MAEIAARVCCVGGGAVGGRPWREGWQARQAGGNSSTVPGNGETGMSKRPKFAQRARVMSVPTRGAVNVRSVRQLCPNRKRVNLRKNNPPV